MSGKVRKSISYKHKIKRRRFVADADMAKILGPLTATQRAGLVNESIRIQQAEKKVK